MVLDKNLEGEGGNVVQNNKIPSLKKVIVNKRSLSTKPNTSQAIPASVTATGSKEKPCLNLKQRAESRPHQKSSPLV